MSDIKKAKQILSRYNRLRNDWAMHGYDTPVMTYHEQLEENEVMIDRLKNFIENGE